mgnify:CR=1 FL=1
MIEKTMPFLQEQLNGYLSQRYPGEPELAVLSGIANADGSPSDKIANKIALTLINVERESVASNSSARYRSDGDAMARITPPLNINLLILVSANFEGNYADSLKTLSSVLRFFQAHPIFTRQTAAGIPDSLERLTVEWTDMDLQSIYNLWSVLGGRYMPSVVYKARMIIISDAWIADDVPVITGTDIDV